MKNSEKLEVISYLSELVKSRSLVGDQNTTGYEYLVNMLADRLIVMKSVKTENYIWPFYIEHPDFIQFIFPSPPFENKHDSKLLRITTRFVTETRHVIDEIISKNPQKIVIDLRNNIGGYLYVFYNGLLPLLPQRKNLIMTGIARDGSEIIHFTNTGDRLILATPDKKTIIEEINLDPIRSRPKCPVVVQVNKRSASSAEFIMVLFKQENLPVIGEPTLGLTTGMQSARIGDATVALPVYIFKDINGQIYQPHDSLIKIPSPICQTADDRLCKLMARNVLCDIPDKLLQTRYTLENIPVVNNIISGIFKNNFHCSLDCEKNGISHTKHNGQIYIHIPPKCDSKISDVLDLYKTDLDLGLPVLIDIRCAKLGDENRDFMHVFDGLYRPWSIELIETTHSQDDEYDRDRKKLDKKQLIGQYAYIANRSPYNFSSKQSDVGQYANINAKFWVNRFSTAGTIASCIFLLYVKQTFGLFEESELKPYYDYSFHKYIRDVYEVWIYTDRFRD